MAWVDLGNLDGASDEPGWAPRNETTGQYVEPPLRTCGTCGIRYVLGKGSSRERCAGCTGRELGLKSWRLRLARKAGA